MITKSISLMLEDVDLVKDEGLKHLIQVILCICATRYDRGLGHGKSPSRRGHEIYAIADLRPIGVQTRITKEYLREEHLSDFVAELLHMLVTQYSDTKLIENVLRSVNVMSIDKGMHVIDVLKRRRDSASKVFTDKDAKLAKAYSRFFVVISELEPKEVLKQMVHLQVHLDSEVRA